jgi:hypothetical protein
MPHGVEDEAQEPDRHGGGRLGHPSLVIGRARKAEALFLIHVHSVVCSLRTLYCSLRTLARENKHETRIRSRTPHAWPSISQFIKCEDVDAINPPSKHRLYKALYTGYTGPIYSSAATVPATLQPVLPARRGPRGCRRTRRRTAAWRTARRRRGTTL